MQLRALVREDLDAARELLRRGSFFEQLAPVAEEKLFGESPRGPIEAFGIVEDGLRGVATLVGSRLGLLVVDPEHRRRGIGSRLLAAVEGAGRRAGRTVLRVADQPGNYVAPGIDARDVATLSWMARRGFAVTGDNSNLLVDVRTNPKVSTTRFDARITALAQQGFVLEKVEAANGVVLDPIEQTFSAAWRFEVARAAQVGGVWTAWQQGAGTSPRRLAGFAAHDGNNAGLGWFGPAGTWPAFRGKGIGEALLLACLLEVATQHDVCEVAWIGPRAFYDRAVGIAGERAFKSLAKPLV